MTGLVMIRNNQAVVSSRQISEKFQKAHKTVLRSIKEILAAQNCATKFFKENYYVSRGKKYVEYLMNRDGFVLLIMGFTGKIAIDLKIAYINAFNEMEAELKLRNEMKQKALSPSQSLEYVNPLQNVEYMGVLGEVKSYITAAGVLSENVAQERLKSEHIAGVKFLSDVLSRAAWKCSKLADINMVVSVR